MHSSRYYTNYAMVALSVVLLSAGGTVSGHFLWPLLLTAPLAVLCAWDVIQTRHSVLRNCPILAHLRFLPAAWSKERFSEPPGVPPLRQRYSKWRGALLHAEHRLDTR